MTMHPMHDAEAPEIPSIIRSESFITVLGFIALGSLPLVFSGPYALSIVTLTFFWAASSLAWNVSGGYAGQFSIGHATFFGIGAYTSTILFLDLGISPWLGMFAGAILAGLAALILASVTMRLRGSFFVMATLAAWAVAHISAINLRDLTNGTSGLFIPLDVNILSMVFDSKTTYAYLAFGLMLIFYIISVSIERSAFGYRLVAYREGDDAARAIGIPTLRVRVLAFTFSAMMTAICGTFHAQYFLYIDPDGVFSLVFSLQVALIAILGGLGKAYGPILGSILITPLALFLQGGLGAQISGLNLFAYATVVIVVLMVIPTGVGPTLLRLVGRRK
jgi:branched-chain amino acid transport system permease protein